MSTTSIVSASWTLRKTAALLRMEPLPYVAANIV
jgi:hypothetical protein